MKLKTLAIGFFAIALVVSQMSFAGEDPARSKGKKLLKTTAAGKTSNVLDANNITSWWSVVLDDGFSWPPYIRSSWNGTFPRNGGVGFIYREGLVIGGLVNDGGSQTLRVQGVDYTTSLQPGRIQANKQPEDATSSAVARVWRVRPDYKTADLSADAAESFLKTVDAVTSSDVAALRTQFENDWLDWPAAKGAPWYDSTGGSTAIRYDAGFNPANANHIPGIPGASQTIWVVTNDLNSTLATSYMQAAPIGLEIQITGWSYSSSTPLNNMMFQQARIIYKGTATSNPGSTIDSMYIAKMSDPDLGDYSDDLAGVDSTLGMAYVYNSNTVDHEYEGLGLPAPAVGFDFLQGVARRTGVATDSAVFGLQWKKGYKYFNFDAAGNPAPLSAFGFYAAGAGISDPGNSENWYNIMRGALPRPQYPAYTPYYTAFSGGFPTKYVIPGDPITHSGWVDGVELPPGDRRIVPITGPFSMTLGDTAEIVVAVLGGMGADNFSSLQVLKYNDTYAQFAFDNLFSLPSPPPSPSVKAGALDKQIVLNWGTNAASTAAIEGFDKAGFVFEGYNVYQLPTPTSPKSEYKRLAVYDLVNATTVILDQVIDPATGAIVITPVQYGNNNGVTRVMAITNDAVRSRPLVNGQTYYFAVTAYAYNSSPLAPFKALESDPVVIPVIPQTAPPGSKYVGAFGDVLTVTRKGGVSDGSVQPVLVDPTATTGHTYRVSFDTTGGNTTWRVTDVSVTPNVVKVSGQTNQSGDALYPIIDGVQIKVLGPPPGMKDFSIPKGNRRVTFVGAEDMAFEGFSGAIGWADAYWFFNGGTRAVPADKLVNTVLRFAQADTLGSNGTNPYGNWVRTGNTDVNMSYAYRYLRRATAAASRPEFAAYIVNATAGYAFQDYTQSVPLSAWDVEANPPARLAVGHLENNIVDGMVDGRYYPPSHLTMSGGGVWDNAFGSSSAREWLFVYKSAYTGSAPIASLQVDILNNPTPGMWFVAVTRRSGNLWNEATGTNEFEILANHVNAAPDVFEFTSSAPAATDAVSDIAKINVFPNPYYGMNVMETDRLAKYVTFNHLPAKATIRIFTIAGLLVRTIEHAGSSQFERWNLRNQANLPVASGVYVVYIDMPDIGATKTLKLAVVQEEQIIPLY